MRSHLGFLCTNIGFEILHEMTARQISRVGFSLQSADHQASFQRADNQRAQFQGIDPAENFPSSFALFYNGSQTI